MLNTLFINLDRDIERLARISKQLRAETNLQVTRVSGILGTAIPLSARKILADHPVWGTRAGDVGCFLSHVKAWELVAESTSAMSLILEDDGTPSNLTRIEASTLPSDFDLIFVNDRMSGGLNTDPNTMAVTYSTIADSLRRLNTTRHHGPGGDGYLLTPTAARILLTAIERDCCYGIIDWRILRYCVSPADFEGDLHGTFVEEVVTRHHNAKRPPSWGIIKAYRSNTPLVIRGSIPSTREELNRLASRGRDSSEIK